MTRTAERVAVTGLGVVSPLAVGAREGFARLLAGERGIGPVKAFAVDGVRARIAAEVRGFEAGTPERAGLGSRTDALALAAAREAVSMSGLVTGVARGSAHARGAARLGIVLGGTAGAMLETEEELESFGRDAPVRRARQLVESPLSSTVLALETALGGFARASTVCSACSSGAVAITLGAEWVLSGRADAVLAGGADALCRMTFVGFNALGALDPEPCRPFDASRRGLTLGEGAGFLLLESESSALARGATVLAWLTGWAVGAEAHHGTHPEPSGARAAALMTAAIERAGLAPDDVDYVNAHGTGTTHNDAMEAAALRLTFGADAGRVMLSSSKAQIGHTLGAAGAIEAAITVLALEAGAAPPTAGLSEPADPDLNHVIGAPSRGRLRAALSNSFGFGGLDAVLLFEAPDRGGRAPERRATELVVSAVGKPDFDGLSALDPERSRRFDRATTGATSAAAAALESARRAPDGVGLVVANAYGNVDRSLKFLDKLLFQGARHAPPAEFPYLVHSAIAGHTSIYLGLSGPVFSACEGELGAEAALADAIALLELDMTDAVLTGAIEASDPTVQRLSPSRFGATRDEGGAILLLETAASAERRGAGRARLLFHEEERGPAPAFAVRAPRSAARARVLFVSDDRALKERIVGTAWERATSAVLSAPGSAHEARGALAFAAAVELLVEGDVEEVLVIAGNAERRFLTAFGSMGRAP